MTVMELDVLLILVFLVVNLFLIFFVDHGHLLLIDTYILRTSTRTRTLLSSSTNLKSPLFSPIRLLSKLTGFKSEWCSQLSQGPATPPSAERTTPSTPSLFSSPHSESA